jgi:hypothetical protein
MILEPQIPSLAEINVSGLVEKIQNKLPTKKNVGIAVAGFLAGIVAHYVPSMFPPYELAFDESVKEFYGVIEVSVFRNARKFNDKCTDRNKNFQDGEFCYDSSRIEDADLVSWNARVKHSEGFTFMNNYQSVNELGEAINDKYLSIFTPVILNVSTEVQIESKDELLDGLNPLLVSYVTKISEKSNTKGGVRMSGGIGGRAM